MGASSGSTRFAPEARSGLRPPGDDPARGAVLVSAMLSLPNDMRLVMAEMGDGESCPVAADIASATKLREQRVLEIMRALRTLGLASYGPLCDVDAEAYTPRGSGYWLWPDGFRFLDAIETAEAIAMEARQRRDAEERPDPKDDSAGRQASPKGHRHDH